MQKKNKDFVLNKAHVQVQHECEIIDAFKILALYSSKLWYCKLGYFFPFLCHKGIASSSNFVESALASSVVTLCISDSISKMT